MSQIIGISGLARSGKDLFTSVAQLILKENKISSEKYALAYELKSDLKDLIKQKTGIDVFTENTEEKNIIRPLLVAYGDVMRKISGGKYWTQKLEHRIANSKSDVIFITDIRYDVYPEDECTWLKYKQAGKLIHVTKYKMSSAPSKRRISTSKPVKIYNGAPNDHEMLNDPKVKSKADYAFEWEDYSDKIDDLNLKDHPYIREQVKIALKQVKVLS
jgi:hypothetical protein